MSKNPHGGISRKSASREWGSKARKRETTQRNLNNRAAEEAVTEQADEYLGKDYDDAFYTEVLDS